MLSTGTNGVGGNVGSSAILKAGASSVPLHARAIVHYGIADGVA